MLHESNYGLAIHHTFNKWKKYILTNGGPVNECKMLKNRQIGRNDYLS